MWNLTVLILPRNNSSWILYLPLDNLIRLCSWELPEQWQREGRKAPERVLQGSLGRDGFACSEVQLTCIVVPRTDIRPCICYLHKRPLSSPKLLASFWPPVKLQSRCYSNRHFWRGTGAPERASCEMQSWENRSWSQFLETSRHWRLQQVSKGRVILLQKIWPREVRSVITTSSVHPTTKTKVQFHQDQRFDSRAIRRHYFKAVVIIKTEARRLTNHSGKTLC